MEWLKIPYRAAWRLVMVDEGLELSGYIAFAAFLSLFPFLIFLAALAGFLGDRETANDFVQAMFHFMPADVAETLAPAIREVVGVRERGLLTFSILVDALVRLERRRGAALGPQSRLQRERGARDLVAAPAEHRVRDRQRASSSSSCRWWSSSAR